MFIYVFWKCQYFILIYGGFGNSFIDPKVPRAIVSTIKSYFSEPGPTWKKVPREVKDFLWKKFEVIFTLYVKSGVFY